MCKMVLPIHSIFSVGYNDDDDDDDDDDNNNNIKCNVSSAMIRRSLSMTPHNAQSIKGS